MTFPPSLADDDMTISIGTMDDLINEDMEVFVLVMSVTQIDPVDEANLILVRNGVALIRINDNDGTIITWCIWSAVTGIVIF